MTRLSNHVRSSVGGKVVMALSGLGLVFYVVIHMLGNLQIFEGAPTLNGYAAFLRDMPILLWIVRAGLLSLVVLHIVLAIRLTVRNRRARPVAYAARKYRQASFASRTMAVSGILLALFILFHLLHLTAGVIDPLAIDRLDVEGHRDVYGKIVRAFQNPFIVVLYVVGQVGLGLHLNHAVTSSLQTLGLEYAAFNHLFKAAGPTVALLVVLGNIVIVLAVFLGIVHG